HPSSLKRLRILILPTCVGLRYGLHKLKLRSFSWKRGISHFALMSSSRCSVLKGPGFAKDPNLPPFPGTTHARWTSPSPALRRTGARCWNIHQLPIDYAFLPRLRGRLTLRRLTLRKET